MRQTAVILPKEERQALFLDRFRKTPYPTEVAELTGIPIRTVQDWKLTDPEFRKQYDEIRQSFIGSMVDKAERNVLTVAQDPRQAWLGVRVLEQFSPEWRRNEDKGLTQINIETAIVNPHGESVPSLGQGPDTGVDTSPDTDRG